eukprot:1160573-Pelagomonas_calceolata.AAC.23
MRPRPPSVEQRSGRGGAGGCGCIHQRSERHAPPWTEARDVHHTSELAFASAYMRRMLNRYLASHRHQMCELGIRVSSFACTHKTGDGYSMFHSIC